MSYDPLWTDRLYTKPKARPSDGRTPSQKDRDRILYTSALRRLGEVTQVVSAHSAHVFHNRLTHSLQVAQVGRRIAEDLLRKQKQVAEEIGGLDPDVVEAACLAHDLGHPPFGHTAEEELKRLAGGEIDSFEGNAQSFRIVTKLAFKSTEHPGLDLTRATLAAVLKYPWFYLENGEKPEKWGAYRSEREDFNFAREMVGDAKMQPTAEAELMDWADDVTYSVHDIEDFYRADRIPLHLLAERRYERERINFFDNVFKRRSKEGGIWRNRGPLEDAFIELIVGYFNINEAYSGTKEQRAQLRKFTSTLIERYAEGIALRRPTESNKSCVEKKPELLKEIVMLKELTWTYVIEAPSMAVHRDGQKLMIRALFDDLYDAARDEKRCQIFPIYYQRQIEECDSESDIKRLVIDLIASMTEKQAVAMYQRLRGIASGSGLEEILT